MSESLTSTIEQADPLPDQIEIKPFTEDEAHNVLAQYGFEIGDDADLSPEWWLKVPTELVKEGRQYRLDLGNNLFMRSMAAPGEPDGEYELQLDFRYEDMTSEKYKHLQQMLGSLVQYGLIDENGTQSGDDPKLGIGYGMGAEHFITHARELVLVAALITEYWKAQK